MGGDRAGRVAIVTGASSGIGAATARTLATRGYGLVLSARRVDRLRAIADEIVAGGGEAEVAPADIRVESEIRGIFAATRERFGGVDVLVNAAGLGLAAPIGNGGTAAWRTMLEVNVLGLAIASREAVRDMERRGVAGQVVHVSSMAGHRVPGPDSTIYAATKHALRAVTEGMRQELRARKSPIRVTAVSPGYVETEFAEIFSGSAERARETYTRIKVLDAADVAEAIAWVLERPPHVEIHDILLRPTEQRG